MSGEQIGNCGKVGGDMLKTDWELDGNIVEQLWCLLFFPPKHLPFYQTSYWQDLLLDFTYLLTYRELSAVLPPAQSHVAVVQTQWTFLLATQSRKALTCSSLLATQSRKALTCSSLLAT